MTPTVSPLKTITFAYTGPDESTVAPLPPVKTPGEIGKTLPPSGYTPDKPTAGSGDTTTEPLPLPFTPGSTPWIVGIDALDLARQQDIADAVAMLDDVALAAMIPDPVLRAQVRALVGSGGYTRKGASQAVGDRLLQLIVSQRRDPEIQDALYLAAAIDTLMASVWNTLDTRYQRLSGQRGHLGYNRNMLDYLQLKTALIETLFSKEDLVNMAYTMLGKSALNNALNSDGQIHDALDGTTTYEATLVVLAYGSRTEQELFLRKLQDTAWAARDLRRVVGGTVAGVALPARYSRQPQLAVA
jgi:hypothetical protein